MTGGRGSSSRPCHLPPPPPAPHQLPVMFFPKKERMRKGIRFSLARCEVIYFYFCKCHHQLRHHHHQRHHHHHHHQYHHCHQDSMQDVKWSLSPPCIVKKITTIIITSSPAPTSPSSRFNARCKVLEVVAVPTLHCERDQLWSRAVVPGVRLSSFIILHFICITLHL